MGHRRFDRKWLDFGEFITDNGHKIWFSGDVEKHQHVVALVTEKEIVRVEIFPVHLHLDELYLFVSLLAKNITIMQAFAPTSDYGKDVMEECYDKLRRAFVLAKKDLIIF